MNRCWLNLKIFVALSLIIFSKDLQFSRQWDIFFFGEVFVKGLFDLFFFYQRSKYWDENSEIWYSEIEKL